MAYEMPGTLNICNVQVSIIETEVGEDDGSTMQVGEYDGMAQWQDAQTETMKAAQTPVSLSPVGTALRRQIYPN